MDQKQIIADVAVQLTSIQDAQTKATEALDAAKASATEAQTKATEQAESFDAQIDELKEQILDLNAKGNVTMKTEQTVYTQKQAQQAHAEALVKAFDSGVKTVAPANTANDDQAGRLLTTQYDAGVLQPLKNSSNLLGAITFTNLENENQGKRFIEVGEADIRPSIENIAMGTFDVTKIAEYREVEPVFGKFYAAPAITREMMIDKGHVSMPATIPGQVAEAFDVALSVTALSGDGRKMKGINGLFADAVESVKADAERAYNVAQTLTLSKAKFGIDYDYTAKLLKKVRRSLASGYRPGAVWRMNENTFDLLGDLKDANGQPLFHTNLHDETEARVLGYAVVIDHGMPDIGTIGGLPIFFGDVSRAYLMFTVSGGMFKELRSDVPEVYTFYHSLRVGERLEDVRALKALKTIA